MTPGNEPARNHEWAWPRLDRRTRIALGVLLATGVAVGLYFSRQVSYLFFHSMVETFSIVIGIAVFMITWNTREYLDNNYLLFLGISLLFVAALDFLHMLAYTGMKIFPGYNADLATQLWIAARYMQALSFLAAPFFLGRRFDTPVVFGCFAAVEAGIVALVFTRTFPSMFAEGVGLTPAKNWSEYTICGILLLSAWLLWRRRRAFEARVAGLLLGSIGMTVASELCFTFYKYAYSFPNFLGHVFKVVAFYLMYRAVIETGLKRPFDLLFRNLRRSEEELRRTNAELEGLAYSVSHDLRGPLAAIGIAGSLAKDAAEEGRADNEQVLDLSATIRRNLNLSFALVDSMLAFARAGRADGEVEEVDLDMTVENVRLERAELIRERGARVVVEGPLGTATMYPTHAYQVFSNLVGNALLHNDSAEPEVVVTKEPPAPGKSGNTFSVRDNGPGIPGDLAASVFEPFVKGPGGATGIGLATVSKIVKLYGGDIGFSTNGGTTFIFELPA